VEIVIEVLRKVSRYALPILIRDIAGDTLKSCRDIGFAVRRRATRLILAFPEELQTLADNFFSGVIPRAANLLGNQALKIRA
jgi:hypothetical protein